MNKKYKLIKKKWNSGCAFQKKIMMMTFFPQKKIFVMFSKKFLMRTFLFKENSSDQQKNLPSFKENYCASLLFSNDFFLSLLKSPPKIVVLFKKKLMVLYINQGKIPLQNSHLLPFKQSSLIIKITFPSKESSFFEKKHLIYFLLNNHFPNAKRVPIQIELPFRKF